jgi:hypothetical protein
MSSLGSQLYPQAPAKRKVFVSYHHHGDQAYYDTFTRFFDDRWEVITDKSLDRARDSDDSDYIVRYIRENHLAGSSVVIVLCGANTHKRKYVDWELYAALNQKMGIIGVKLPTLQIVNDGCAKPARLQDNINAVYAVWASWWENLTPQALISSIEASLKRPKDLIDNSRQRMTRNAP